MPKTVRAGALAASTIVATMLAACGGSTGGTTPTSIANVAPTATIATPTEDAGVLATRVADSTAAKLGPMLLSTADYPQDLRLQQQGAKILPARDVPGLTSEASGFFATVASAAGDEFVNLIVLAAEDKRGASAVLDALTPENYLAGLTQGARDAATSPFDLSSAPPGSKGFRYSGTVPASVPGQTIGRSISGQALGFVRGNAYVLLVHGVYVPSTRGIDVATIGSAIEARLAASGAVN